MNHKATDDAPDTQAKVLAAAEAEFLVKGFDGARTSSIAERAGVTHAMLHYYFRTKENLYREVVKSKMDRIIGIASGFFISDEQPFPECIKEGVRRHFDYLAENPDLPLFLLTEIRRKTGIIAEILHAESGRIAGIKTAIQENIDRNADAGLCCRMDALMLISDIVSLNVFTFLGLPMTNLLFGGTAPESEQFLRAKREENVETIIKRLKP